MHSDPLWMADQVTYQIFPDRFAIGKPHTSESKLKLPAYRSSDYSLRRWDEMPESPSRGKHFFGGVPCAGGYRQKLQIFQTEKSEL